MDINTDEEFPTGLRVKHKRSEKIGTVQAVFGGPPTCYDPWEVPVKWDGEENTEPVNYENLVKM